MKLEYVPLLQLQHNIYRMPRNMERFQHYLSTMINDSGDDLDLPPLVGMNPMAREHVPALLDQYLELDADRVAEQTIEEVLPSLSHIEGEFKLSLVILDDLKGGWTNRYTTDFGLRFNPGLRTSEKALQRASWLTAPIWSSEPALLTSVREEVLMTVHRTAYRQLHGPPRTLRDMLAQEGVCLTHANVVVPILDPEDMDYTRQVIAQHLDAGDMPTVIAGFFGDEAARSLGFLALGLSYRAGFALAKRDLGRPMH